MTAPKAIRVGGVNGAGKTTFARQYLPLLGYSLATIVIASGVIAFALADVKDRLRSFVTLLLGPVLSARRGFSRSRRPADVAHGRAPRVGQVEVSGWSTVSSRTEGSTDFPGAYEALLREAMALPKDQRLALLDELSASFDGTDDDSHASARLWVREVSDRIAALRAGTLPTLPSDVAMDRLEARFRARGT
jgi:Putative addiction module component